MFKDNIIALIPARISSKRIKQKNIKLLNNVPLIVYSISFSYKIIRLCYVSSDSQAVLKIAKDHGAGLIHRPKIYATDTSTDQEVIKHAIENLQDRAILGDNRGLIVYLRPTTPFRQINLVKKAINIMIYHPEYTGLRSVELMGESALKSLFLVDGLLQPIVKGDTRKYINGCNDSRNGKGLHNGPYQTLIPVHGGSQPNELLPCYVIDYTNISKVSITDLPNQLLPPTYKANGYVDIARVEEVLRGNLWGDRVYGFVTPWTIEIDTPEDWERAEWFISQKKGG
jgi:CMP-N-acetylneuraminic acid synthetase